MCAVIIYHILIQHLYLTCKKSLIKIYWYKIFCLKLNFQNLWNAFSNNRSLNIVSNVVHTVLKIFHTLPSDGNGGRTPFSIKWTTHLVLDRKVCNLQVPKITIFSLNQHYVGHCLFLSTVHFIYRGPSRSSLYPWLWVNFRHYTVCFLFIPTLH